MYRVDPSPVKMITTGGWWRIYRDRAIGAYAADAFPRHGNWYSPDQSDTADPLLHIRAASSWQLEERLGFALPTAAHELLGDRARATRALPDLPAGQASDPIVPADLHPFPASPVLLAGEQADSYGRLLHDNPPARTWADGPFQIDIVETIPIRISEDRTRYQVSYRIWHEGTLVLAADDITMPITADPLDDDAVRAIVDIAVHAPRDDLSARQREFLTVHGENLHRAVDEPGTPYPAGLRVAVQAADGQAPTTGIITGTVTDPDGAVIDYLWRPDLADLPGHPWQAHPDRLMASPAHRIHATLAPADTGLARPGRVGVLTFGARIRTIDDPAFTDGTILRVFRDNDATVYEIQPDTPGLPPMRLPADHVIPVTGTAWPTLNSLLDARDQAGVPLRDGETLTTLRESTRVTVGLSGPIPVHPVRRITSHDPVLDPAALDREVAGYRAPPYGPRTGDSPVAVEPHGAVTRIRDPRHGVLDVPTDLFTTARTWPAPALAVAAAHRRPPYFLEGDESPLTLAALVCAHTPELLRPDLQPTGPQTPPAADRPPPAAELGL